VTIRIYMANPVDVKKSAAGYNLPRSVLLVADSISPNRIPCPKNTRLAENAKTIPPHTGGISEKLSGNKGNGNELSGMKARIDACIRTAASKYGLDPELIKGVVRAESDFRPNAVSPAGAQGLMQLMPGTAKDMGVKNPFDIEENIEGGTRYLKKMLDNFGGDVKTALAAYNAGPGTVKKFNGMVPYKETKLYVERVLKFSGYKT